MKPSSFSVICTNSSAHELKGLLLSLSIFHTGVNVYIISDNETKLYIENMCQYKDLTIHIKWFVELDKYTNMNRSMMEKEGIFTEFLNNKAIVIKKALNYEKDTLLLDCDIVITHPIDQVFKNINSGQLYMHVREGLVSDRGNKVLAKVNDHYKNKSPLKIKGKPVHEFAMWNAGVLGFNTKYAHVLDEVLTFTDSEYPNFPKHIIEQFAFSIYFQQAGLVKAAAPYIFHYWNLKEARDILSSFFDHFKDKNWDELTQYSSLVQMHALMQDKANFYRNRGMLGSMTSKKWLPEKQDWNELIKQL